MLQAIAVIVGVVLFIWSSAIIATGFAMLSTDGRIGCSEWTQFIVAIVLMLLLAVGYSQMDFTLPPGAAGASPLRSGHALAINQIQQGSRNRAASIVTAAPYCPLRSLARPSTGSDRDTARTESLAPATWASDDQAGSGRSAPARGRCEA